VCVCVYDTYSYIPAHALDYVHAHAYNILYIITSRKSSLQSPTFFGGTLPNQITARPLMFSPRITYVMGFLYTCTNLATTFYFIINRMCDKWSPKSLYV